MVRDGDSEETTSSTASNSFLDDLGGNAVLLAVLLLLLVVVPFLPGHRTESVINRIAWSALIIVGILRTSGRRHFLWAALIIAIPSLLSRWIDGIGLTVAGPVIVACFFLLIVAHILTDIFSQSRVRVDHILGGINVYLLLGVLFTRLHVAVEKYNGGSYMLGDVPLAAAAERMGQHLENLLQYFSFTTLTTLGYGDIHPVSHAARVLSTTEAVVGPLFLVILIARLVSVYTSRQASVSNN